MEAWKEELYHGLISQYKNQLSGSLSSGGKSSGGKAGRTWKHHKYIRIENGRYIYPEDLNKTKKSNMSDSLKDKLRNADYSQFKPKVTAPTESTAKKKSSGRKSSGGRSSGSSKKNTSTTENKSVTETKPLIDVNDKGSVGTFADLPENPEVNDMYFIEELNRRVYWDGELWTPIDESQIAKKKD